MQARMQKEAQHYQDIMITGGYNNYIYMLYPGKWMAQFNDWTRI